MTWLELFGIPAIILAPGFAGLWLRERSRRQDAEKTIAWLHERDNRPARRLSIHSPWDVGQ